MPRAVVFDIDGTLVDSVDLHALCWRQAFEKFGHVVSFEDAREQIGKGGDKLLPVFLSQDEIAAHGDALEKWRGDLFRSDYLPLVRPFSAVPELFRRVRASGLKIAVASSAQQRELDKYLEIAGITHLVDATTSSDDAEQSKPSPDIFQVALKKLGIDGSEAFAVGDSPYDAEAAIEAGMRSIGVLCGGFTEQSLREAGAEFIYPSPGALWACLDASPLT